MALVLKQSAATNPKLSVYKNPSASDLLSLTDDDIKTVWEKFQFGISKREMYSINSPNIQPVLDQMRSLPIAGLLKLKFKIFSMFLVT